MRYVMLAGVLLLAGCTTADWRVVGQGLMGGCRAGGDINRPRTATAQDIAGRPLAYSYTADDGTPCIVAVR